MKSTQSQTVNITIPKALLKQVDALAKRDYTSRSDVIRQALLQRIRQESGKKPEVVFVGKRDDQTYGDF